MHGRNRWTRRGLGLFAIALSGQAWALCSVVSTVPAGFGSVSSITVRTTSQPSSTPNAGLSCTGSLASQLTASDHLYATFTAATSGLVGPTGDVISYTLYGNNSTSYPITRGTAFDFARNSIADNLGLLSNPIVAKTVPIYLDSISGSNVAAGVYSETLSVAWNWNYCYLLGTGNLCVLRDINNGTTSLTVTMTVTNDCLITAPDISFGSAPVISGFTAVTNQTVNLTLINTRT